MSHSVARSSSNATGTAARAARASAAVSTNTPIAFESLESGPHALILIQTIDEVGPVGIEIK